MCQLLCSDLGADPELLPSIGFGSGHNKNKSTKHCTDVTCDREDVKWLPATAEDGAGARIQ